MSQRIRAKFYLQSIETTPHNTGGTVKLSAVTRGARNSEWSAATPSGQMQLTVTNPDAFEFFTSLQADVQERRILYPEVFITMERATADDLANSGHAFEAVVGSSGCALCGSMAEAKIHI